MRFITIMIIFIMIIIVIIIIFGTFLQDEIMLTCSTNIEQSQWTWKYSTRRVAGVEANNVEPTANRQLTHLRGDPRQNRRVRHFALVHNGKNRDMTTSFRPQLDFAWRQIAKWESNSL